MASYLTVIIFSLIGGVFSLAGGLLLLSRERYAAMLAKYATPFAAGALLAAAFIELLPEALEITADGSATRWVLAGIIVFFLLEHFLHWFHHHHEHGETSIKASVPLIVIGDTLHNLIDGIAIGAAFLINIPAGIVATLAVATHEIPQEVGDFGLLLKAGLPKKKVLLINIASAFMSTVGAVLTFSLGTSTALPLGELLAVTAGLFIYIAASDLIPTIHETSKGKATYISALLLIAGVVVVSGATELAHRYTDAGHSDGGGVCIVGVDSPCDSDNHNSPTGPREH